MEFTSHLMGHCLFLRKGRGGVVNITSELVGIQVYNQGNNKKQ